jgi:branched-chain amino acid transport system substrate-binding protein
MEALGPTFAEDEVVYGSASYAEKLMTSKFGYNFFGNRDYTSQNRALLKWISENDPCRGWPLSRCSTTRSRARSSSR